MFKEVAITGVLIAIVWLVIAKIIENIKQPKERPKLSKRGAVTISTSKWGLGSRSEWPFGSLKIYTNSIKISTGYNFRLLEYKDIKSVKKENNRLIIYSKKTEEYIAFVSWDQNQEIIQFLKSKKVKII